MQISALVVACAAVSVRTASLFSPITSKLVRPTACMECGACARNCPVDAITVEVGTGCATAQFIAALKGSKEPTCSCC